MKRILVLLILAGSIGADEKITDTVRIYDKSVVIRDGSKTSFVIQNQMTLRGRVDSTPRSIFSKEGPGWLGVPAALLHKGPLLIMEGTIVLKEEGSIGHSSSVMIGEQGKLDGSQRARPFMIQNLFGDGTIFVGQQTLIAQQKDDLVFNGIIRDGGIGGGVGGSLLKQGEGKFILTAPQRYTGRTIVGNGTLAIGKEGSIAKSSGTEVIATLDLSALDVPQVRNLSGTGKVLISSKRLGFLGKSSFQGAIVGSGGVTAPAGSRVQFLSPQQYGGTTQIEGVMELLEQGSIASSSAVLLNGLFDVSGVDNATCVRNMSGMGTAKLGEKTLIVEQSLAGAFDGAAEGHGTFVKTGSAPLFLRGQQRNTGLTRVAEGKLSLSENATLHPQSSLFIESGAVFNIEAINHSGLVLKRLDASARDARLCLGSKKLTLESGQFAGIIEGVGAELVKNSPAKLTLSGNNLLNGMVRITEGELELNGELPSAIYIEKGARLTGNGISGSLVNRGTIAVGRDIGTWTAKGHFVADAASSQLEVEIDAFKRSDMLTVTGDAALNGTLVVDFLPQGVYIPGTTYKIMSASEVSGAFSKVIDSSEEFDVKVDYRTDTVPMAVELVIVKTPAVFRGFQFSPNVSKVADHITKLANDNKLGTQKSDKPKKQRRGDMFGPALQELVALEDIPYINLNDVIGSFLGLGEEVLEATLDQFHTASFGAITEATAQTAYTLSSFYRGRRMPSCCNRTPMDAGGAVWFAPFGQQYVQPSLGDQMSFRNNSFGAALGWQGTIGDSGTIGVGFAAERVDITWPTGSKAHMTNLYPAVYGGFKKSMGYFNAAFLYGFDEFDTTRKIELPIEDPEDPEATIIETLYASAFRNGAEYIGSIEGGFFFGECDLIVPFASVTYAGLEQMQATEDGADDLSIRIGRQMGSTLFSQVGIALRPTKSFGWGCAGMEIFISGLAETPIDRQSFTNSFAPFDTTFTVDGYNQTQWFGDLGATLFIDGAGIFSGSINYEAEVQSSLIVQKGVLELRMHY